MIINTNRLKNMRHDGFTLIEILVVLVIMGTLVAIATPALLHWRPSMQLRAASEDLLVNMQKAKLHAIKTNRDVIFTFNIAAPCPGGSYSFADTDGTVVAHETFSGGKCLSASTLASGTAGYKPKGLPIIPPGAGTVTLEHESLQNSGDPIYIITQTVAGIVQSARNEKP